MKAVLDAQDFDVIAAEVKKRLLKDYYLTPKQQEPKKWLSLKEFVDQMPVKKDKEWFRLFILQRPEVINWVINLNAGKGHATKIAPQVVDWVYKHQTEIDWKQPLPR